MGGVLVRIVAGVFFALGGLSIASQAFTLLKTGQFSSPGRFVVAMIYIAVAFLLLKGSDNARIALSVFSAIMIGFSMLLVFTFRAEGPALFFFILALVSGGCLYLLLFSKSLKEEISKRAELSLRHEQERRRTFYQDMGEKPEE